MIHPFTPNCPYPFPYRQRIWPHWHWTNSEFPEFANQTPLLHDEHLKNSRTFSQASISLIASELTRSNVCDARLPHETLEIGQRCGAAALGHGHTRQVEEHLGRHGVDFQRTLPKEIMAPKSSRLVADSLAIDNVEPPPRASGRRPVALLPNKCLAGCSE